MASGGVPVDVNALVQWVLRESYLETNKDLQFYADKVRYYNDRKKALRKHVREIRGKLGKMGSKTSAPVPTLTLKPYRKHARGVIKSPPKLMTKSELEAYIERMEEELASVGDDSQLANIDLHNWLQKQQQTLQMMSTISKQLHDTAMAIIRKMGG
jgi:hypothetical protein